MSTTRPFPIVSAPGIKRDSTQFEGENYTDGNWCRFSARALPRKMAGYQAVTSRLPEIVRGMDSFAIDATNYVHFGTQSFFQQQQIGFNGAAGSLTDRTPVGYVPNVNTLWQLAAYLNKVGGATSVVACPTRGLTDIASSTELPIYYGVESLAGPLVVSGMDPVSGGIVAVPP
jgi:hypothetical protein